MQCSHVPIKSLCFADNGCVNEDDNTLLFFCFAPNDPRMNSMASFSEPSLPFAKLPTHWKRRVTRFQLIRRSSHHAEVKLLQMFRSGIVRLVVQAWGRRNRKT